MAHKPVYANGITIGPVVSLWAHLFTPRQFQGKGDPKFALSLVLNQEQTNALGKQAYELAQQGFPNGEYGQPGFQWPMVQTEQKIKQPKLGELFPGHTVMSAKSFEDSPPTVLVPKSGAPGEYEEMSAAQRGQLIFDGALCYAVIDLATYDTGSNTGVRAQLNTVVYYGAGEKVAVGSKPDGKKALKDAGIKVTMQAPAGHTMPGAAATPAPQPGAPAQAAPVVTQEAPTEQAPGVATPGVTQAAPPPFQL